MRLIQRVFGFNGRIGRAEYWRVIFFTAALLLLLTFLAMFVAVCVGFVRHGDGPSRVTVDMSIPALVIALLVGVPLSIGRLHDRDKSGWWLLVFFVAPVLLDWIGAQTADRLQIFLPLASVSLFGWAVVELGCLRGTAGTNRYGPEPLGGGQGPQ